MREGVKAQEALRVNWKALAADNLAAARAVHEAVGAMTSGEADADQQRVFMTALRQMFCRADALSFTDNALVTSALEGRRSVWIEIDRAARAKLGDLTGETYDR